MGYSQCQIAQSCAVARSTVQDYVRRATAKNLSFAQLSQLSDSEIQQLLGKGKQKTQHKAETDDFATVEVELQRKGVTLALLWQEGLDKGQWHYSYATFCRRYNQWRLRQKLSMRQVYKGGEKLFVDYCGLTVPVVHPKTGEVTTAQIFVACLGASNYTYAEATQAPRATTLDWGTPTRFEFLWWSPQLHCARQPQVWSERPVPLRTWN